MATPSVNNDNTSKSITTILVSQQ